MTAEEILTLKMLARERVTRIRSAVMAKMTGVQDGLMGMATPDQSKGIADSSGVNPDDIQQPAGNGASSYSAGQ